MVHWHRPAPLPRHCPLWSQGGGGRGGRGGGRREGGREERGREGRGGEGRGEEGRGGGTERESKTIVIDGRWLMLHIHPRAHDKRDLTDIRLIHTLFVIEHIP